MLIQHYFHLPNLHITSAIFTTVSIQTTLGADCYSKTIIIDKLISQSLLFFNLIHFTIIFYQSLNMRSTD
jgi:hypothetical protein